MHIGDQCRSLAAKCYAHACNPFVSPRERLWAFFVAGPVMERAAAEMDRHNVLTAAGTDLRSLGRLYGVEETDDRAALLSSLCDPATPTR